MYDMRHTFGTYLYAQTKDIKKVAHNLGYTKTQNVDHYVFLSQEIENQVKGKRRDLFHQALRQPIIWAEGKLDWNREKGDTCKKHPCISRFSPRDLSGPVRI